VCSGTSSGRAAYRSSISAVSASGFGFRCGCETGGCAVIVAARSIARIEEVRILSVCLSSRLEKRRGENMKSALQREMQTK